MNPRTYDLSMLAGTVCCTGSAYLLAGSAAALGVAGVLTIALTVVGVLLTKKR